jgi:phenylalanine-4-hydroxylase
MADERIPDLEYTVQEKEVWRLCYEKLMPLMEANACQECLFTLGEMEKHCGFRSSNIPQLQDISEYITRATGWRLKPVGGLLSGREFLNGLAFKTFHSTQYIRHHSKPFYTPEPDVVHELFGHAAMFAHKDFAEFSQQIGLASLGADEAEIKRLAAIYWYTIEFGMCLENGKKKSYGAGINSSVEELTYCVTDAPGLFPLDCFEIGRNHTDFPISSVQPYYFLAESLENAKVKITEYCNQINRPFHASYNNKTSSVEIDRKIKTRKELD